ncbi:MAG: TatD family hydrolase [Elusimicrobiota bacterium]
MNTDTGYFDTHAHLVDERFKKDRFEIIKNLGGIICIFEPGEDIQTFNRLLEEKNIWGAAGIHPHSVKNFSKHSDTLNEIFNKRKIVAVGEIGLDFYYKNSSTQIQRKVFEKQLDLARDKNLPVIIHSRKAFKDTLNILDNFKDQKILIHCFTGTSGELDELLKRGYYIALGGVVTFSNTDSLRAAVKRIPVDKLLLETDSPYLSPSPLRGKRNQPGYVKYTARCLSEIRGKTPQQIKKLTFNNARKFFEISG